MEYGEDEYGKVKNGLDAGDGNCIGNGKKNVNDEQDALGSRPTYGGEFSARMTVPAEATHYKMDHKNRGLALIFNHENFEVESLAVRRGTNEDSRNLEETMKMFNFIVTTYKDYTYDAIKRKIEEVSKMDHTHNDCIVITFLTHGDTGILYAKDSPYKAESLFSYFTPDRCPSLAGKPKIFFIQACQGDQLDQGITLRTETDGDIVSSYKIPLQADFLIVYSTIKGYYSWRNTTNGSWFVQALCECLRKHSGEYDLLGVLTFVAQYVAIGFESNVPGQPFMHRQKQIPCVMSMLTRLIRFPVGGNSKAGSAEINKTNEDLEKSRNLFKGIFQSKGKTS